MVPTRNNISSTQLSLIHRVEGPRQAASAGQQPPILFLLHGVGSNENDLLALSEFLDPRFLIVSVRSPLTFGPGSYGWYPVQFTPQGAVGDTVLAEEGRQKLITFIGEAVAAYGADPERVYLMGFSQGAIMSLFTGLTRPDLVDALVIMSGRLLPQAWENRASDAALQDLPIIVAHGLYDSVLKIADGRDIRDKLTTLPVTLTYHEYPMAHEVSRESLSDITRWLTARLGN